MNTELFWRVSLYALMQVQLENIFLLIERAQQVICHRYRILSYFLTCFLFCPLFRSCFNVATHTSYILPLMYCRRNCSNFCNKQIVCDIATANVCLVAVLCGLKLNSSRWKIHFIMQLNIRASIARYIKKA